VTLANRTDGESGIWHQPLSPCATKEKYARIIIFISIKTFFRAKEQAALSFLADMNIAQTSIG
jgi:hypothetical protein